MPSSRHELRSQARAIPLVTVSLAHGHVRQTRRNQSRTTTLLRTSFADQEQHTPSDLPPAYDTLHSSTSSNGQDHNHDSNQQQQQQDSNSSSGNCPRQQHHQQQHQQLVTASPSDADVTDAVLHLSRTLVSNTAKANDSQSKSSLSSTPSSSSSWVYMMLYSWTQTAQTATRLFHILTTQPSNLLKEIQGQNEQALLSQQRRQPRKSIQQLTEEEDRMEDDPDMINGTATEMVSVSMMNTRTVAGMAESLSEQDTEMQDRPGIRKIEQYQNPFAPAIAGTDEQEDDEGWLGRGDLRSESGATKSNSVRLTSTKLTVERALPNFNHRPSSLGAAMDPHQFETRDRDSILLDYEPSSRPLRTSLSTPSSIFNTSTGVTFNRPSSSSVISRTPSARSTTASPSATVATSAAVSPTKFSLSGTAIGTGTGYPPSINKSTTTSTLHPESQLYSPPQSPSQSSPQAQAQAQPSRNHHFHSSQQSTTLPDSPWADDEQRLSLSSTSAALTHSSSASISTSTTGHVFESSYVEELVS